MNRNQFLKFTTPLPPSANHYLGKRIAYKGGRPYVQFYETKETIEFKRNVKKVIRRALEEYKWVQTDALTHVKCEVIVYIPHKRRDADNVFKVLLDTINENNVIADDCLIVPVVKNIFVDKDNPRVDVEMMIHDKVGVFKDEETYKKLIDNYCSSCSRFTQNCSLLKKSRENKIISEIDKDAPLCFSYKPKKI